MNFIQKLRDECNDGHDEVRKKQFDLPSNELCRNKKYSYYQGCIETYIKIIELLEKEMLS